MLKPIFSWIGFLAVSVLKVSSYSIQLLAASGKRRVDYAGNEKKHPPGVLLFFTYQNHIIDLSGSSFQALQSILKKVA